MLPSSLLRSALANGLGSAAAVQIACGPQILVRDHQGTCWQPTVRPAPPGIDQTTLFDLASLTKPMATTAIAMALVSQGWLNLAWPVGAFFAGFAPAATIADLLSHRAGCASHVMFYQHLWSREFQLERSDPRYVIIELAQRTALAYPSRQQQLYSDLGYMMLATVLERITGTTLDQLFARWVATPLQLPHARFIDLQRTTAAQLAAVATEQCAHRGLVIGQVHDENCHAAGGIMGHAGLFGTIDDVGIFAAAILRALNAPYGTLIGAWRSEVVQQFFAPIVSGSWRMGWDTPSPTPGVSHAGDRWPRHGGFGHLGFTGTSLWLDVPRQAYVALLTNRVHPQRATSADGIKQLRRAIGDAAVTLIDRAHAAALEPME